MTSPDVVASGIRLSDSDRAQGQRLLNEHVAAGCLSSEEFGDRAVQVEQTRTRAELQSLFADLPQPHPRFDEAPQPARPAEPVPRREEVPHLRYAATAVLGTCAAGGVLGGVALLAQEPKVLFLGVCVMLAVYLVLLVSGGRPRR
ncbi:DUF1707 domain-containing protein [Saccharopolyspora sp. MS10]|uniref:DUF1707 SHOCT-like domain-containing protein n=1 Tax=Saccharopolyspora sp. MS10 TaxID=3385973 RepID=UPI0039A1A461